jgi:hypothetical protein
MGFRDTIKRQETKKDKVNGNTNDTASVVTRSTGTGNSFSAQSQPVPPTQEAMNKRKGQRAQHTHPQ